MKGLYYKIMLTGAVTVTMLSCQIEQDINNLSLPERDYDTFYATIDEIGTKVYADESQKILWDGGDLISIFNKNTMPEQYSFRGMSGSNSGSFEKVSQEGIAIGNSLSLIYAVYPYSENTTINNDGVITLNLPAAQYYRNKTFGPGANTMVSVTNDNKLRFKNTVGYLVLKVYGSGVNVKSISLTGNNHEKLAGKATISMDLGGLPILTMDESATESVNLVPNTSILCGKSESECTELWFAIPPVTFSKGFTITITNSDGAVFSASNSQYLTIERNSLYRMEPLEVIPDYSQFTFHDFMTSDGSRPAMITFTDETFWGEVHDDCYIRYYEVDGIRYCETTGGKLKSPSDGTVGEGPWGTGSQIRFRWHTNKTVTVNGVEYQYIEVEPNYVGYDSANGPLYMGDYYWMRADMGLGNGSYTSSYDRYINAGDGYNPSYYDGNGGFVFNVAYWFHGTTSWYGYKNEAPVGIAEGYSR